MVGRLSADAQLDAARRQGDPPADDVVGALGQDVWAMNALLARVTRDDDPLPAGICDALRPLVLPPLPAWADVHRMRSAQAFAEDNLASITVALFCAALPASYAAARGARVLATTGRLRSDLDRRVNETARFVLAVLRPNAFDAGGAGRIAVGKVRLVHAAVRRMVRARGGCDDVPINQEDMLGTLGLFSVTVLDALTRLGVRVVAREKDDFVHLWCAIGAMLGVREDLLPPDYAGMRRSLDRVRARNVATSDEGRRLTRDLLQGMERHLPLPGMRELPRQLVRHLLGAEVAAVLDVPAARSPLGRSGFGGLDWATVHTHLGRRVLEAVTFVKLGGRATTFAMPA